MSAAPAPDPLDRLAGTIPYIRFLGLRFERRGDEITALMPYRPELVGNPLLPALHGGAIGAFLEITAVVQLASDIALQGDAPDDTLPPMPKPVDMTFDYLRSGKPMDTYARALVQRRGRRVANVRIEAWQEERAKLIATAHGHFLVEASG